MPAALAPALPVCALVLSLVLAAGGAAAAPAPNPLPAALATGTGASGLVTSLLEQPAATVEDRADLAGQVQKLADALGGPLQGDPVSAVQALPVAAAGLLAGVVESAAVRLPAVLGAGEDVDLGPVLRVARGVRDDVHRHDYAVLVDGAGDDLHLGAAGGNMLDLQRPPSGPEAARGCEQVFPDATSGRVRRGPHGERTLAPPDQWRPECVAAVGVLLDLSGDDTYGRFEAPGFPDDQCTRDPVVRRIATQGAGVAGVGLLHDASGADRYLGKTLTQGSGHLWDDGGRGRYLEARRPSETRGDGVVLPSVQPAEDPLGGGSVESQLFVDREPG